MIKKFADTFSGSYCYKYKQQIEHTKRSNSRKSKEKNINKDSYNSKDKNILEKNDNHSKLNMPYNKYSLHVKRGVLKIPNSYKREKNRCSSLPNRKCNSTVDLRNNTQSKSKNNEIIHTGSKNKMNGTLHLCSSGLINVNRNENKIAEFTLESEKKNIEKFWNMKIKIFSSFYLIPLDSFTINKKELIYYSEFTEIYKGKYLNLPVAIKTIPNIDGLTEKELELIKNEIEVSLSLHHPFIVNTYGISFDKKKNKVYILSEFCSNFSLKKIIESKEDLNFNKKVKFCYQISLAVLYLHTRNPIILHRDLKSANIFIDEYNNVKLGDFGMIKLFKEKEENYRTNSQSTPFWMAPEFMSKGIFTEKSDIYSLGLLFWEIFMEDTKPFAEENVFDFILGNEEILKKRPEIELSKLSGSNEIKQLIEKCWDYEPNNRPYIGDIVNFFEGLL
ncbi:MAG: protein kinase [archaeon]|nr:protein kinase [archaeon]